MSIPKVSIRQIKAARALLAWSQEDLAERSGVSVPTIKRLEASDGPIGGRTDTADKIAAALEAAGVEFTNGGQPGVRIRKKFAQGDYARAHQIGPPKVSVGRDHTGEILTTITVPVDRRK
jgi:transcriptional regulator with XRE-family HTH domain